MHPLARSATDLVAAVRSGDLTAVACTEAFLDRIESLDGRINAFLAVDRQRALDQAATIDARRKAGQPLGALAGLPVAVKDALCTIDFPTTCASRISAKLCRRARRIATAERCGSTARRANGSRRTNIPPAFGWLTLARSE